MSVEEWIAGYARAWESKDPDLVVQLFTPDGLYHDQLFEEPHVGRQEIRAYWQLACSTQDQIHTRFGTPTVNADESRGAVEFWVRNLDSGSPQTLAGILFLRFSSEGLCQELREAWCYTPGHLEPAPNWGG